MRSSPSCRSVRERQPLLNCNNRPPAPHAACVREPPAHVLEAARAAAVGAPAALEQTMKRARLNLWHREFVGGQIPVSAKLVLSYAMSSQRGNSQKNRKPAHQNKFAFVANKHDSKAMAIVELPLGGVCAHCLDVLEWRKRMNRFKPIKNIGKCQVCQQRNITQVPRGLQLLRMPVLSNLQSYHRICDGCATERGVSASAARAQRAFLCPDTRNAGLLPLR